MGYLQTILTYHRPSEAEEDKTFLEFRGFEVCLCWLNGNASRNELGAPFYFQRQFGGEDCARGTGVLREANSTRSRSATRVTEPARQIKRTFFAGRDPMRGFRAPAAIAAGFSGGYSRVLIDRRIKRDNGVRA